MGSAAILFVDPEATAVLAAWEALVTIYELIMEAVSGEDGTPMGDEFTSTAEQLESDISAQLSDTANGLERMRQVISRLRSPEGARPGRDDAAWTIDSPDTAKKLTTAANANFYSKLMPIPYGVYALVGAYPYRFDGNPDTCYDNRVGYTWRGSPASAHMQGEGRFNLDGFTGDGGRFVLGKHSLGQVWGGGRPPTRRRR
jgi:hypothetical protein